MKKNDIILIGIIGIICAVSIFFMFMNKEEGGKAIITIDGNVYKEVSLSVDQTIVIDEESNENTGDGHKNIIEIKDGYVKMLEANCPDGLCVKQKKIKYTGESIICLPHKVVITIEGTNGSQIDGIAN